MTTAPAPTSLLGKLIQLLRNSMVLVGAITGRVTTSTVTFLRNLVPSGTVLQRQVHSTTGIPLEKGQAEIAIYFNGEGNLQIYIANYRDRISATMPRDKTPKLRDYLISNLGNPLLTQSKPKTPAGSPELFGRKIPTTALIQDDTSKPEAGVVSITTARWKRRFQPGPPKKKT